MRLIVPTASSDFDISLETVEKAISDGLFFPLRLRIGDQLHLFVRLAWVFVPSEEFLLCEALRHHFLPLSNSCKTVVDDLLDIVNHTVQEPLCVDFNFPSEREVI